MRRSGLVLVSVVSLSVVLAAPLAHAAVQRPKRHPIAESCAFNANEGGDNLDHGFYVSKYGARDLHSVTLQYFGSGNFTVTLSARRGSYNGDLIGRDTERFSDSGAHKVQFLFGNAPVHRGGTLAFIQHENKGGTLFVNDGRGDLGDKTFTGCPGVVETEGTSPPLDEFRRASFGVLIRS